MNTWMLRMGKLTGFLLLIAGVICGCAIDPTEEESLGAVRVEAYDTTSAHTLSSGTVFVNGVPRGTGLPVVIGGLPAGTASISLRPGEGYPSAEMTVQVTPPDTAAAQFLYSEPTLAYLKVSASGASGAVIVLDEQLRPDLPLDEIFTLSSGQHDVSVYREGYSEEAPALAERDLEPGETDSLMFTLTGGEAGSQPGQIVPDFELQNDMGGTHSIAALRGQVVLITFWFYNCPPCRAEFPAIEQTWQERAADGFRVLGVNVGWQLDSMERFTLIRSELGLSFPLLGPSGESLPTTTAFNVAGAPTNFIVDRSGIIRYRFGSTNYADLNAKLDDVMNGN